MYYEERIIMGTLCCRTSPTGEWKPLPPYELTTRLTNANKCTMTFDSFNEQLEKIHAHYLKINKGVDKVCELFGDYAFDSTIFDTQYRTYDMLIDLLSLCVGDEYNWVAWYCFDAEFGNGLNNVIVGENENENEIDSNLKLYELITGVYGE